MIRLFRLLPIDTSPILAATSADATNLAVVIPAQTEPNVKPSWFAMKLILIDLLHAFNLLADQVTSVFK